MLILLEPQPLKAITSKSYRGTTIPGRASIAVLPGPGGTRINSFYGNLFLPRKDALIPGRGIPIELELTYSSNQSSFSGPFGFGWRFSYGIQCLILANQNVVVQWSDGRNDLFVFQPDGTYTPFNEGVFATLQQSGGMLVLTTKEQLQFFFDTAQGLLQGIQDPNGNALTFSYSGALLTTVTDASGRSISLSYDANGRVITVTDANVSPSRSLQYAYDSSGNQTAFTDFLGNMTTYAYDSAQRLTSVTDPLGITSIVYGGLTSAVISVSRSDRSNTLISQQSFAYDTTNLITTVTDAIDSTTQASTTYQYDGNKRLSRTTDALGNSETRTYDSAGNIASITNGNGETATYTYDAKGNILTDTDALGHVTTWTYNPTFNSVASITDPNNNAATFNYDATGNLISVVDALGNQTVYGYDALGQRTSRKNANGFTTAFTYDNAGNVTSSTDPLGRTQRAQYDGDGNLRQTTDGNNHITVFSYDQANRLTGILFADGSTSSFTRDALGNLLSAVDPHTNLTLSYNGAGWLTQVVDNNFAKTIGYSYDMAGRRTQMVGPNGVATQYSFDLAHRLTSTTRNGQQFTFSYDNADRLANTHLPNGAVSTRSYDAAGHLLSVSHHRADGSVISSYSYQYDNAGRRTQLALASGDTIAYSYDNASQLKSEVRTGGDPYNHQFTYDAVGNRTQLNTDGTLTSYTYDAADQLTAELTAGAGTTYSYDGNGNRTSKVSAANTISLSYDDQSRLTGYTNAGVAASYVYDALGRRTAKTAGGLTAQFVYDGSDVVSEYDGAGTLQAENWYGAGFDDNLARTEGGQTFFDLHDGLNSVGQIIDNAGTVQNSYDYDAWGVARATFENVSNPTRFTGRDFDSESGLYHYRLRAYDAGTARFFQQDPVDDNSGRSFYSYVVNNPVNSVDPSGAVPFLLPAVIAVGIVLFGPERLGGPRRLNVGEEEQLRQQRLRQAEDENRRLRERVRQQDDEIRRLREENERLRRQQKNPQGQLNGPRGGNEVGMSGMDGDFASGTNSCAMAGIFISNGAFNVFCVFSFANSPINNGSPLPMNTSRPVARAAKKKTSGLPEGTSTRGGQLLPSMSLK